MVRQPITVEPNSELAGLLEQATDTPLLLEKDGVRYHLARAGVTQEQNGHERAELTFPPGSVVQRTAGLLRSDTPLLSAEEERAAAERAIAEDVVRRMGG